METIIEEYNLDGEIIDESDEMDLKYGDRKWYLMKVADAVEPDYGLNDFPTNLDKINTCFRQISLC